MSDGGERRTHTHPENQLSTIPATGGCQVKPLSYLSPPHSPTTVTSEDTAEVLEPAGGRGEEEENSHLLTSAFQIPHLGQGEVGEARNFRFS